MRPNVAAMLRVSEIHAFCYSYPSDSHTGFPAKACMPIPRKRKALLMRSQLTAYIQGKKAVAESQGFNQKMAKKMHELTITANKDYMKLVRKMNANKPHMKRAIPSRTVEDEDDPADDEVEGDEGEGEGEDDEESDESDEEEAGEGDAEESHQDFPIIH